MQYEVFAEEGAGAADRIAAGVSDVRVCGGTRRRDRRDPADGSAGIGGGTRSGAGTIEITGGTVHAYGTTKAPAIGTGSTSVNNTYCNGGSIVISGGNVTAEGVSGDAAAIVGGSKGGGVTIAISGGQVKATRGLVCIGKGKDSSEDCTTVLTWTDASFDTLSVTSPSYSGTVTLEKDFKVKNTETRLPAGAHNDKVALLAGKTLVPYSIQYTITFDSDGGSEVAVQTVIAGTSATEPEAPTKEGFTFDGWTLNGEAYDFDSAVTVDITLTAVWEAASNVTINGVSGSFNDRIKLNYYFGIPDAVLADEAAYVTLTNTATDDTVKLPVKKANYVEGKGYKFGSSRKVVGCTSLYTKFHCVTGATIAFATVLFTAKPC